MLQHDAVGIPRDNTHPGRLTKASYVFVADEGFTLQKHIMKPFPGLTIKESK